MGHNLTDHTARPSRRSDRLSHESPKSCGHRGCNLAPSRGRHWVNLRPSRTLSRVAFIGLVLLQELTFRTLPRRARLACCATAHSEQRAWKAMMLTGRSGALCGRKRRRTAATTAPHFSALAIARLRERSRRRTAQKSMPCNTRGCGDYQMRFAVRAAPTAPSWGINRGTELGHKPCSLLYAGVSERNRLLRRLGPAGRTVRLISAPVLPPVTPVQSCATETRP
jgi:hypothetical protein